MTLEDNHNVNKRICSHCSSDKTYLHRSSDGKYYSFQWRYDVRGNLLCSKCYSKYKKGRLFSDRYAGSNHHLWKGGNTKTVYGYIKSVCKGHYRADKDGYVFQHILIFERNYNCCVLIWGVVHHKNGIKDDNRIENLIGMTKFKHMSLHKKGQVKILERDLKTARIISVCCINK